MSIYEISTNKDKIQGQGYFILSCDSRDIFLIKASFLPIKLTTGQMQNSKDLKYTLKFDCREY